MSSFFWSFKVEPSDVNKKQSFVGQDTGLPTRLNDQVYLTAQEAEHDMADIKSGIAKYALFYDVNLDTLTSEDIASLELQIKALGRVSTPEERAVYGQLFSKLKLAQLAECDRRKAKGEIRIMAVVGAFLHESLLSKYDEDYHGDDDYDDDC